MSIACMSVVISVWSEVMFLAFSASFNACLRNLRHFYLYPLLMFFCTFYLWKISRLCDLLFYFPFSNPDIYSSFFHYLFFQLLFVSHGFYMLFHYSLFISCNLSLCLVISLFPLVATSKQVVSVAVCGDTSLQSAQNPSELGYASVHFCHPKWSNTSKERPPCILFVSCLVFA